MTQPITTYLTQIAQNLATGDATEHTHRPALASLSTLKNVGRARNGLDWLPEFADSITQEVTELR